MASCQRNIKAADIAPMGVPVLIPSNFSRINSVVLATRVTLRCPSLRVRHALSGETPLTLYVSTDLLTKRERERERECRGHRCQGQCKDSVLNINI